MECFVIFVMAWCCIYATFLSRETLAVILKKPKRIMKIIKLLTFLMLISLISFIVLEIYSILFVSSISNKFFLSLEKMLLKNNKYMKTHIDEFKNLINNYK